MPIKRSSSLKRPYRRVSKKPMSSRRRLQPAALVGAAAVAVGKRAYNKYKANQKAAAQTAYNKAKRNYNSRITASDNITTLSSTVVGNAKAPGFDEKVMKVTQQPLLFTRNYQWSAEGYSGRKAHFVIELNKNNSDDLLNDIGTYKDEYFTNNSADVTAGSNLLGDKCKFYIDSLKEKLNFMNSSSNALTGKMTLYAHKRDNANLYGAIVPVNPITLMMYYSTQNRASVVTTGFEGTVGNGFNFDITTAGANYTAAYNMPGSSLHPTAVCASTDPTLSPSSHHVKDGIDYWFRKVSSETFSLKPGQQIAKSFIFNDLPEIAREQNNFIHVSNVSFVIHVEFQGQIVGDGTVTTGDGVVSTGTTQLSCTRNSTRIIGIKNKIRSKVILRTAPLNAVTLAQQLIINPDTGVSDTGVELDT